MAIKEDLPEDRDFQEEGTREEKAQEAERRATLSPHSLPVDQATPPLMERPAALHAQLEFSGPLPPPQILGQYDDVLPGAAERILRMAEKQQDHRIGMDQSGVRRANWGLGAGFTISVLGLLCSGYVIMHGHEVAGSVLGGATLLSLVSAFIQGSKTQSRENIEKTRLLTGREQEEDKPLSWAAGKSGRTKKRKR